MDWNRESDAEELEAAFWDMRGVESATQRTDQLCFMWKMIVNSYSAQGTASSGDSGHHRCRPMKTWLCRCLVGTKIDTKILLKIRSRGF